jgi:hypothetical protein
VEMQGGSLHSIEKNIVDQHLPVVLANSVGQWMFIVMAPPLIDCRQPKHCAFCSPSRPAMVALVLQAPPVPALLLSNSPGRPQSVMEQKIHQVQEHQVVLLPLQRS